MATLLEYVGNVHIYLGPYRGNPIALYLKRNGDQCVISPKVYPWNEVVGVGETPNKAAADFEDKWKAKGLSPEMYTGPSWEGGIKPERPKPAPPPKPAAAAPSAATQPSAAAPLSPPTPEGQPGDSNEPGKAVSATDPNRITPADAPAKPTSHDPGEPHPRPEASAPTNSPDEKNHSPQQN